MSKSGSKMKEDKHWAGQMTSAQAEVSSKGSQRKSKNMHDGVPVWYDCCLCEAEPYWLELVDETDPEVEN
jgi:hypothetical protein